MNRRELTVLLVLIIGCPSLGCSGPITSPSGASGQHDTVPSPTLAPSPPATPVPPTSPAPPMSPAPTMSPPPSCQRATCDDYDWSAEDVCIELPDGCGGEIHCGNCPSPLPAPSCERLTCGGLGWLATDPCSSFDDDCGGTVQCGACQIDGGVAGEPDGGVAAEPDGGVAGGLDGGVDGGPDGGVDGGAPGSPLTCGQYALASSWSQAMCDNSGNATGVCRGEGIKTADCGKCCNRTCGLFAAQNHWAAAECDNSGGNSGVCRGTGTRTSDCGLCCQPICVDSGAATKGPPATPTAPGTSPIDNSFTTSDGHTAISFPCYGACGASCNLAGKKSGTMTQCVSWADSCGYKWHRIDQYDYISGESHPFCAWHDQCYESCAFYCNSDGRFNVCYQSCTLGCDEACISPSGGAPPKTWSNADCACWASTEARDPGACVGQGTQTFTRFTSSGGALAGDCSGKNGPPYQTN